jgi:hypothetical protein
MAASSVLKDRAVSHAATVLLVTCTLVLGVTAGVVAWPRLSHTLGVKPAAATREMAYRTGQTIDVPVEWYQSSPYTVVIFARASCGACQTAQPFLKQLVAGLKGRASVVLAGSEFERDDDAAYGRAIGLKDQSLQVAPAGLKVRATPTLVIVNQRGEVLGAWEGVGPPTQQSVIAKAIDRAIGV